MHNIRALRAIAEGSFFVFLWFKHHNVERQMNGKYLLGKDLEESGRDFMEVLSWLSD
jgi:hypothetical protein